MDQWMLDTLSYISLFFDIVGIALIIYGGAMGVLRIAAAEFKGERKFSGYENAKRMLIQKLIFALDFFLAADLLRLVSINDISEVLILGAIVAIRTVLSWSLSREVHLHKED